MAPTSSMTETYLIYGKLTDKMLEHSHVCLVTSTNSVTCINFGVAKDIAMKYPYGAIVGKRRKKTNKAIAIIEDREEEGSVCVREPQTDESDLPTVATLITQYGIGKSIEYNNIAKSEVNISYDQDHVKRLLSDKMSNRFEYFRKSIAALTSELTKVSYDHIRIVAYPAGIGIAGVVDDILLEKYLTVIRASAATLAIHGIMTCIVSNKDAIESSLRLIKCAEDSTIYRLKKSLQVAEIINENDILKLKPSLLLYEDNNENINLVKPSYSPKEEVKTYQLDFSMESHDVVGNDSGLRYLFDK